jgi:hypothetical protein
MKYFENLPKRSFASTIGNFNISSFFTYIDADAVSLSTDNVLVDSKTTLLEASYDVYQDLNNFWAFLLAAKKINPFDLLSDNTVLFTKTNENKINFATVQNVSGTTGIAFPQGSIIAPYIANTGSCSSFGYIGNFDLNGPISIIESVSFYDGNMVIKDQKGATYSFMTPTGSTGQQLTVIYPTATGYSVYNNAYVSNKEKYLDTTVEIKKPEDGKIIFKNTYSSLPTTDQKKAAPVPVQPTQTIPVSVLKVVEDKSKNILCFLPSEIGTLKTQFITVKYS